MRAASPFSVAVALLAAGLTGAACRNSTQPELEPMVAAGVYTLESVSVRGPVAGTMLLTPVGFATRRVRYESATSAPEYVAVGTFQLERNGAIAFALREDVGTSTYAWNVEGERRGGRLTIQYPDGTDGIVVETYRRH
jgi:hypothetical protein